MTVKRYDDRIAKTAVLAEHYEYQGLETDLNSSAEKGMESGADSSREVRNYKDTVFVDLFYTDEAARHNLLSLYNALSDTSYTDPSILKGVRLEKILYMPFANDIAFIAEDKRIVLGEHQSTLNQNMPLRCLLYAAREYEMLVPVKNRFRSGLQKIPTPEFLIFYNGTEPAERETVMCLSDAYKHVKTDGDYDLELKVKMININPAAGHPILEKCPILKEYGMFVDKTRNHRNSKGNLKTAIEECIKEGILSDYLARKSSEVINMLMAEYDYDLDMQVKKEEAKEELREEVLREVREEVLKEVQEQVQKELREKVQKEFREKVQKELREKVQKELQEKVQKELREEVQKELQEKVQKELREEVQKELQKKLQEADTRTEAHNKRMALNLYTRMNMSPELIADMMNCSQEQVEHWIR